MSYGLIVALLCIMVLVTITSAMARAIIGKCTINPFDIINLLVGAAVTYLLYFYKVI